MTNAEKFDLVGALKKMNPSVKESTLKTYARSIRRLAKIAGHDTVPNTKGWLVSDKGKALLQKIEKMPLKTSRHLFVAGSIAFRSYSNERSEMWTKAMNDSAIKYTVQRNKQEKSNTERKEWPRDGYKSLMKAASTMKRKVSGLLKKKEYNHEEAYEMQKYIILLLYSHHTFRLSPSTLLLKSSDKENTLLRPRGSRKWVVTLRDHKTVKSMGTLTVPLSLAVSKVLSTYIPKLRNKHDYFLSLRNGEKMGKGSLSALLLRLTKSILNKKIGVRLARVLKVTSKRAMIDKSNDLLQELGHSSKTQKGYIRKD